ncbi:hypothetical protein L2719_03660 [Shewanella schlegeliana]|uniref:Uncharacterized protein n=1 Tax=Shewanella schlegeliana TaxID=190308 RepID=A0ABS1SZJ9_9GAMM|nr:hypothetical protein [Shewanella schlegeliana]MBL4913966.1 hypothetical protein [Shewanella schlegeliana]MCL1108650.1 hypothetical protein [Shewanella schlegeliana]GIU35465.1 hypothetical protein TUM4433_32870 [Shewanella schlegeliana]
MRFDKVIRYLGFRPSHRFVFASSLALFCLSNLMCDNPSVSPDEKRFDVSVANLSSDRLAFDIYVWRVSRSMPTRLAKGRYNAGLVCQDKGWEFCARWAHSRRSPRSRLA